MNEISKCHFSVASRIRDSLERAARSTAPCRRRGSSQRLSRVLSAIVSRATIENSDCATDLVQTRGEAPEETGCGEVQARPLLAPFSVFAYGPTVQLCQPFSQLIPAGVASQHRVDGREYTARVANTKLAAASGLLCRRCARSPKMARNESLLRSLKALLDAESRKLPEIRYCPDCDSLMGHRIVTFTLASSRKTWQIPFPFCPECNPTARH
jgi:hypothetical protein